MIKQITIEKNNNAQKDLNFCAKNIDFALLKYWKKILAMKIVTYAADRSPIQTCSTSHSNLVTNPFENRCGDSIFMESFQNFHGTSTDSRLLLVYNRQC